MTTRARQQRRLASASPAWNHVVRFTCLEKDDASGSALSWQRRRRTERTLIFRLVHRLELLSFGCFLPSPWPEASNVSSALGVPRRQLFNSDVTRLSTVGQRRLLRGRRAAHQLRSSYVTRLLAHAQNWRPTATAKRRDCGCLSRGQNLENGVICRPTLCDLSGVGGECEPGCYCDRSPWDGVTGICMSATDYPAMRPEALLAMYGLHPLRRQ
ncbi:uncharacterized protein LOC144109711 [Amblyomma americanum]